jgi:hypothetical protein
MKHGTATATVQADFTGNYKAYDSLSKEITDTADVRFWRGTIWSGDDYGGDASENVGEWTGVDGTNGNIRTDDSVAYVDVQTGVDSWNRTYVS